MNGLSIFKCECQFVNQASCEWRHQYLWHVWVSSVGTQHICDKITSKQCFHFSWSVYY